MVPETERRLSKETQGPEFYAQIPAAWDEKQLKVKVEYPNFMSVLCF